MPCRSIITDFSVSQSRFSCNEVKGEACRRRPMFVIFFLLPVCLTSTSCSIIPCKKQEVSEQLLCVTHNFPVRLSQIEVISHIQDKFKTVS